MPTVVWLVEQAGKLDGVLFVVVDLLVAWLLMRISSYRLAKPSTIPSIIGFVYLLNPFNLLAALSRGTAAFSHLAIVGAFWLAIDGQHTLAAVFAALAGHLSLYPFGVILPILLMRKSRKSTILSLIVFLLSHALFLSLSMQLTGSWAFLQATYGCKYRSWALGLN